MPSPKYPLKPLLEHRERKVDDATAELGDAVRAREAADAARARAEATRRDAEERASHVRAEEAERLGRGELSVADLARGQAWEIGASAQIRRLTEAVEVAEQDVAEARDGEASARVDLARKMADRDVVVKDEARFVDGLRKRALAAEEEAAEEARRGGGRRS
ncbi:MAG: hypothetical protein KF764_00440 [Labilithrix sp.]|nr:hypothetical protein [Labilithrix sp.]MBX3219126.1 hypothetical protein [Labilithrix sp.]